MSWFLNGTSPPHCWARNPTQAVFSLTPGRRYPAGSRALRAHFKRPSSARSLLAEPARTPLRCNCKVQHHQEPLARPGPIFFPHLLFQAAPEPVQGRIPCPQPAPGGAELAHTALRAGETEAGWCKEELEGAKPRLRSTPSVQPKHPTAPGSALSPALGDECGTGSLAGCPGCSERDADGRVTPGVRVPHLGSFSLPVPGLPAPPNDTATGTGTFAGKPEASRSLERGREHPPGMGRWREGELGHGHTGSRERGS